MMTTWVSVVWFIFTTFVPAFGIYLFMLAMFLSDPKHGPTRNTKNAERGGFIAEEPKNEEIYGYYDPNCDHSTSSCDDNSSNSDIFEESDGCEGVDNDVVETEPSDKKIQ